MKARHFFIGILSTFLLYLSCTPPVVFSEPQPQGYEAQPGFPFVYRGTFFCTSDSAFVHVDKTIIYKEKDFPVAMTLEEIDTLEEVRLVDDQLYIDFLEEPIPATIEGDSVFSGITLRDTLFDLRKSAILKQYKGHQIMNKPLPSGDWEVIILSMDDRFNLVLSKAIVPSDLERLAEITPVENLSRGDTIQYRINPSPYAFDQILREQLVFEACDYYERIRVMIEM